jgi:hypothetical protein
MARNFGISNVRTDLGGRYEHPPARSRADTRRDLNPLLPFGSVLKSFEVSEPPVDKFEACERALLFVTTAAALLVALALLFVDLS